MQAIALLLCGLFLAASGLTPSSAWGQGADARPAVAAGFDATPIGKVVSATGSATIEHTSGVVVQAKLSASGAGQAKVDDLVYRGDTVQTGANSSVSMIFSDGTTFNVSSNARMELNEFVYDPNGSANSTLINLSKGSFTFLAGKVAKGGGMKIETPVGTMGIRGTAPRVEILDNGSVKFSTLIEENKNATDNIKSVPIAVPKQRRAQNTVSPDSPASRQEKNLDKKLNICQGC